MTLLEQRWWHLVDRRGDDECWPWKGAPNDDGYGHLKINGKSLKAHRLAYEILVAPIPDGLVIDHLCRNRICVNPAHLEPVTSGVNTHRGATLAAAQALMEECVWGHPLSGDNLRVDKRGKRVCRLCNSIRGACHRVENGIASVRDQELARQAPWTFDLTEGEYKELVRAT